MKGRRAQAGPGVHLLGVDDGPFERGQRSDVLVVGVVMKGAREVDGVLTTRVRPDGHNATRRLAEMVAGCRFHDALRCVLLDGIALGGFNVVDLPGLAEQTGLPVIAVTRRTPDLAAVKRAIERLPSPGRRWRIVERAGAIHHQDGICFQYAGAGEHHVRALLRVARGRSRLPEAVRLAHLIGAGVVRGESSGRP